MRFFVALIVDGALAGAIYALIALGFVVVYKASRVINFALGEWLMLGALLVAAGLNALALGLVAAISVAVVTAVFRWSRTGVALRAIADDDGAATAVGIDVQRHLAIAWGVLGVVSVLAGTLWASVASGGVGLVLVGMKVFPVVV